MDFGDIPSRGLVLLGCGKMGSAMLEGWLKGGLAPTSVWVLEPRPSDWLAAQGALSWLAARKIEPVALSGLITRAPLAAEEAAAATGLPVFDRMALADPAIASAFEARLPRADLSAA